MQWVEGGVLWASMRFVVSVGMHVTYSVLFTCTSLSTADFMEGRPTRVCICVHGCVMPDVHVRLHTCAQPLDHTLTRHRRRPAPSPAHHCWCWCLSRAMRGVLRSEGRLCVGADRPALVQGASGKHASEHLAPRPICACPRYQHTTTNKPGTK